MIRNCLTALLLISCGSIPIPKHKTHNFPKLKAYYQAPQRKYRVIGQVRSKVNFPTIDPRLGSSERLCQNYFNKSVADLVKYASEKRADAVIGVQSIVFYLDGTYQAFPHPECSDDGTEGQVLTQGKAIRYMD